MKRTGFAWRYSRSKKRAVMKGEESGNTQRVRALFKDCDGDAFLALVQPRGPACGEGYETCFYRTAGGKIRFKRKFDPRAVYSKTRFLDELYSVIVKRIREKPRGSFTAEIARKKNKVIGKLCEEATELLEAKNKGEKISEAADLLYFTLVLLATQRIDLREACAELEKRREISQRCASSTILRSANSRSALLAASEMRKNRG
jgi:phosphoribosyl-ATP pyrophosphohydrolase/phosphoribosyl-AMP cyclohydrolase